ncbi:MAG: Histidine-tRNA ligase [Parcubacteria group bacterium GW2011_GWA2_43_17]|nr:MAG: Histidine-tRNA ligase [Parcubacteria group bacterium GW2011_GWA2_43_17]KKT92209.1 MAG: Histidine-tRNA ligase [Parcubacteria group bacterium GW2011_GWF2_45_11]KKT98826.1 MAG: Histidine-tRNA ligase [Parcubacteria group bacterium GW2011_GWC2_45_15]OGY96152.1 MAG: histidine--tRNA ligase [Candidatus Komeilibacteria bacterium RIFOXYC2_FULL_45_12]
MPVKKEKKTRSFQLVKGMKDILPDDQKYWQYISQLAETLAVKYGFSRIDIPLVEDTQLFTRSVGQATDIVEKEMYSFIDKGGENISLRPEFTAGIARAYIEHGMINLPQPVKLYSIGPCFRYDKPQSGRYRQFHQLNFETIGDADPVTDAQIILIAYKINEMLNLPVIMQVNSVGCPQCRPDYELVLKDYFKKYRNKLSEVSQKRLLKNPLRILDSKEDLDQTIIEGAPQQVDHLCEECKNHFIKVLEYLDELEVPYALNPTIVRGLDYYTRTTFEVTTVEDAENGDKSRQIALGGGGRYDKLYESLGGRETPVVGFAAGIERLIGQIKEKDLKVPALPQAEIFLAQLGTEARRKALVLFEELYRAGFKVTEAFSKSGIKPQLEMADRLGAKLCLIVGQKEIIDGTVMIRDMDGGIQEVVDYKKIVPELRKRLEKMAVVRVAIEDKTV